LLQFVDVQDERLKKYYDELADPEKIVLARTVKLAEELGELCQEVLAHLSLQRPQKLDKHDKNNLSEEFADVLVTTLLLAKSMDIDVENALKKKIQTINTRFKQI
jgi:NTP pyrophosphatase (non-canonical NTP hydrolase)